MMEQVYGTTEDQIREVKSIARRFLGKTQNYQGFSKSFKTSVEEQVNKKVLGLLQEQKPKVLVYGIYNAGKSTLVNVLCGKEVAEVGDRPTTMMQENMSSWILRALTRRSSMRWKRMKI